MGRSSASRASTSWRRNPPPPPGPSVGRSPSGTSRRAVAACRPRPPLAIPTRGPAGARSSQRARRAVAWARQASERPAVTLDRVGNGGKRGAPVADAIGLAGRGIPKILKTKAEIAAAPIDHRAGFLLAHIDGKTAVQALVDIAGMPESDVHEILDRLRRLGIVVIR